MVNPGLYLYVCLYLVSHYQGRMSVHHLLCAWVIFTPYIGPAWIPVSIVLYIFHLSQIALGLGYTSSFLSWQTRSPTNSSVEELSVSRHRYRSLPSIDHTFPLAIRVWKRARWWGGKEGERDAQRRCERGECWAHCRFSKCHVLFWIIIIIQ